MNNKYKTTIWGTEAVNLDWLGSKIMHKFLVTTAPMSIQVHPGKNGGPSKNETWFISEKPEPGSFLYLGLKQDVTKDQLREAAQNGSIETLLNRVMPAHGDVYNVPAGILHAIGSGLQIDEVQENCDITFRLYDYNRIELNGSKRELHLEQGLEHAILSATEPEYIGNSFLHDINFNAGPYYIKISNEDPLNLKFGYNL